MNINTKAIKVNKAYEELAGVKRENIMGKCALDFDSTFIARSTQHTVFKTKQPITIEKICCLPIDQHI